MPALYLVATPIGNLEDITLRALRVLKEAGLIAAEDTRTTRKLLSHYDIHTPLTSYHQHNKKAKLGYLLAQIQEKDVALVSEAGTPGLSDPGYELVLACLEESIPIVPIPGPSAITTAVTLAGLANNQFLYLGFLHRRKGERQRLLEKIALLPFTLVFLEAPHRLKKSLIALEEALGDRRVAVCRELTKLHEEVFRGSLSQALDHFAQPKGEFTLVIEGHQEAKGGIPTGVIEELRRLCQE
ncbi:MAG: 16S rRNA (cytidine(1402)-2'-O)-methyltransferase, partial [Chloroflexota bacterium]